MKPLLSCDKACFSYHGQATLQDVSLDFHAGEFVGLIGPNGAGKSTLLNLLMGFLKASSGQVELNDSVLDSYSRRELARNLSFVPQDTSADYGFTVREVVAMGRNPYLGAFEVEKEHDLTLIEDAMRKVDLESMSERRVDQLSGGERQRVFIGRSLAQETPVLMLDEPTANLDLCHQLDTLRLVEGLVNEGILAIAAIHDLSLASRFCSRLVMLSEGNVVADGKPADVLTPENLYQYFSIEALVEPIQIGVKGVRVTALNSVNNAE